jgi:hypothetical protein
MKQIVRRAAALVLAGAFALVLARAQTPAPATGTPQERLDALVERMEDATNEFFKVEWRKEMSDEERQALYAKRPGLEFVPEFEALAVEAKGTDVAAEARLTAFGIQCNFQQKTEAGATLEKLLDESIGSKALSELPPQMQGYRQMAGKERVTNTLEMVLQKTPHDVVKASCLLTLGEMFCASNASETQMAKGRKYFERLIAEYPTAKGKYGVYKEAAEGFLFALDNLQIGKQAPDFEVTDENGTKFKLSDYRGKVVVIDFWGMW